MFSNRHYTVQGSATGATYGNTMQFDMDMNSTDPMHVSPSFHCYVIYVPYCVYYMATIQILYQSVRCKWYSKF